MMAGQWNLPDNQSQLDPDHPIFSLPYQRAAVREHDGHFATA